MFLFILATFLSFITCITPYLTKPTIKWMYKSSTYETGLQEKRKDLLFEQSKLSMVDDFPKYSRIQRTVNSIEQELSELQNNRQQNNFFINFVFNNGLKVVLSILLLGLSIYYRSTAVLYISEEFNLYPIASFVSYPCSEKNAVSFPFWVLCCSSVISLIKFGD